MIKQYLVYIAVLGFIICGTSFSLVYGYTDIGQLMAKKYYLTVNGQTHTVFYFLHNMNTSNPDISNMDYVGKISSITLEPGKNAMLITLENIQTNDELSVGFDSGIIIGDSSEFTVFVDGQQKGFATLEAFGNDTVVTVVAPIGTQHVEIVGPVVAPEFGSVVCVVLVMSITAAVLVPRRFNLRL